VRRPDLYQLSGSGTNFGVGLALALAHADRARAVDLGSDRPDDLRRIKRLMRLDLRGTPPPPWIGELRHLRVLKMAVPSLAHVPPAVFALPKLRELYLQGSGIVDLAGLETSSSLEWIFASKTPLAADEPTLAALQAATPGMKRNKFGFLSIPRTARPRPTDKATLIQALADDTLDDATDLSGADLRGATIEDGLFLHALAGADLRGARLRRCDFALGAWHGIDLSEAVFEDCFLDLAPPGADRVVAAGARFERCALRLRWPGADLRGARFVALEDCPLLAFDGARADGIELAVEVVHESEINVSFKDAELRAAKITFDIDADRRAELTAKPNPRLKWATNQFEGATTDAATEIVYAPLPAKPAAEKRKGKGRPAG
jgi:uncharacterized protein YjbI with pentapeptide repeats